MKKNANENIKKWQDNISFSRKGSSNIEIIMTMVLMILFGAAIFTMIFAGGSTQKRILEEKDIKVNARVAASYINVKIKQHDQAGSVNIKNNPITNTPSLVITEDYTDENGVPQETWIYCKDGQLNEELISKGESLIDGNVFEIAKIDNFDIRQENNKIYTTIDYTLNGKQEKVENVVSLRSQIK